MTPKKEIALLKSTIIEFIDSFDGFNNEFQYDFIIHNIDNIVDFNILTFSKEETIFNFKESEELGYSIGPDFFLALNEMPFFLIKLNTQGFYRLRQELHDVFESKKKTVEKFYITAPKPTYKQMLQMEEWRLKRLEVIDYYESKCARCESTEKLQVHHKVYRKNTYAWDYDFSELECICNSCHFQHHKAEKNGNSLDIDLAYLDTPHNIISRIEKKIEILSYVIKTYDDPFLLMVMNEGTYFEKIKNHYTIDIKHVRKRKFISHDMIVRHLTKINLPSITYKNNIIRVSFD